ncbi:MAG: hypothetical protein HYX57_07765 [Chloroflexi bacterium]|nr:hypothetical protein [Chloroflexota bacterium]
MFLAVDLLVLVPLGLFLIWLAMFGEVDYWDDAERLLVAGLGLVDAVMFLAVGAGLVRYNILGHPRVQIEPGGLLIGSSRFAWHEIDEAVGVIFYGVPYLLLAISPTALVRLSLVDRASMRLTPTPKTASGHRYVSITEQQLAGSVDTALDRLAPLVTRR